MPHGAIPFPFGDCRICNDKATGVHYGVATCEGCKGFFKRSIPKGDKYKCFFGGHCMLTPQNRNRCKACRFRRCLAAGMSVEAVKMGRIPKIDKERALEVERRKEIEKMHQAEAEKKMNDLQYVPLGMGGPDCDVGMGGITYGSYGNGNHGSNQQWYQSVPPGMDTGTGMASPTVEGADMALVPVADSMMLAHGNSGMPDDCRTRCSSTQSLQGPYSPGVIKDLMQQVMDPPGMSPTDNQQLHNRFLHGTAFKHDNRPISSCITTGAPIMSQSHDYNSTQLMTTNAYSGSFHGNTMFTRPQSQNENTVPGRLSCSMASQMKGGGNQWMTSGGAMKALPPGDGLASCRNYESNSTAMAPFGMNSCNIPSATHGGATINSMATGSVFTSASCNYMSTTDTSGMFTESFNSSDSTDQEMALTPVPSSSSSSEDPEVLSIRKELEHYLQEDNDSTGTLYSMDLCGITSDSASSSSTSTSVTSCESILSATTSCGSLIKDSIDMKPELGNITPFGSVENTDMTLACLGRENTLVETIRSFEDVALYKETLKTLTKAMLEHDAKLAENYEQMQMELAGKISPHPLNMLKKATRAQVQEVWDSLMSAIPEINDRILGFAKAVPGFNNICNEDQQILMEYASMDLWLLLGLKFFHNSDLYLLMPCGARYSYFWVRHFFPKSIADCLFRCGNMLQNCQLTLTEQAIISCVQLTCPDRKGLKNVGQIRMLNNFFLDLLAFEVPRNHGSKSSRVLIDIFRILPQLEPLNEEENDIIMNFSIDHPPEGCLRFCEEEEIDEDIALSPVTTQHDKISLLTV